MAAIDSVGTAVTTHAAAPRARAAASEPAASEPVDSLASDPDAELSPPVNRERLVETFLRLVQVPGPTRNERQIADQLKREYSGLAESIKEDGAGALIGGNTGNLIINIKGNVPDAIPIMFSSHMDTVRLAVGVKPQINNGVITSDGTTALGGDDRAGQAEILEAIREVKENNLPHGDIQLVLTVAEEGGLLGSAELDPADLKGRFAFVMDVFKANHIYTQGRHLLAAPPDLVTPQMVNHAHTHVEDAVPTIPDNLNLTPEEKAILGFTSLAMERVGEKPEFFSLEFAGTDAIMLREKGISAISLGAGENNPHTRRESVEINDLVRSTRLVRSIIDLAARTKIPAAAAAVGGPIGAALAQTSA
jgi:di/tripeptidase